VTYKGTAFVALSEACTLFHFAEYSFLYYNEKLQRIVPTCLTYLRVTKTTGC